MDKWTSLLTSFKFKVLMCSALICIFGFTLPAYNWDIVGYTAAVYKQDGFSGEKLSSKVYGEIARDIDSKIVAQTNEFRNISGEVQGPYSDYRYSVFTDPVSLEQHIPFYSIKFVYVQLIFLLYKLGMTASFASYLISAFFSGLIFLKLSKMASKLGLGKPIIVSTVISLVIGLPSLARLSTPDALGAFCIVLLGEAILFNSKSQYAILSFIPFIRPDYIILQFLYFIASLKSGKRISAFTIFCSGIVGLWILNHSFHAYSFQQTMNFLLFNFVQFPSDLPNAIPVKMYLGSLISVTIVYLTSGIFCIYLLHLLLVNKSRNVNQQISKSNIKLVLIGLYPILHLILFPYYEFRFFSGVTALSLLIISAEIFSPKMDRKIKI